MKVSIRTGYEWYTTIGRKSPIEAHHGELFYVANDVIKARCASGHIDGNMHHTIGKVQYTGWWHREKQVE
jgi:hypothetical protein